MKAAFRMHLLAATMAVTVLSGCKKGSTYVQVQIVPAANEPAGVITKIDLQMTLAGKNDTKSFSDGGAPITLPTSITLQVGSGDGQMAITAICLDAQGAEVDRGVSTADVKSGAIAQTNVQLAGGKPVVVSTEAQHNFASTSAGQQSSPITITFQNHGFQPSNALTVALGGAGAAQFAIGATTCTGTHLAPGASCTVTLIFRPVISGAIAATLTISGAGPGADTVVALTGSGNPNPQSVGVALQGTGLGSVTSSPAGMACASGSCSGTYDYGASVTLTAVPALGSHFSGWSGDCAGVTTCTLSMTQARSSAAQFDLDSEQLSLTIAGNGAVSSGDGFITCDGTNGPGCISTYHYGDTVTLTAVGNTGFHLVGWTDPGCTDPALPCTLTMHASTSLNLVFSPNVHTANVSLAGLGDGVFTTADSKINCAYSGAVQSGTCSASYDFGGSFTIQGTPGSTSFVNGFTVGGAGSSTCAGSLPCDVTVGDSDIAVGVTFDPTTLNIDPNPGNGTGTLSCSSANNGAFACLPSATFQNNDVVTITAAPDVSSTFNGWTGCDSTGGLGNVICTVSMAKAKIVTPTFKLKTFTVTIGTAGSGAGTFQCAINGGSNGSCPASVNYNDSVVITANPNTGSNFSSWAGCTTVSSNKCALSGVTTNKTVTATFTLQPFIITVNGAGGGTGSAIANGNTCTSTAGTTSGTCSVAVPPGGSVSFVPTWAGGNVFNGWSGLGCGGTGSCTVSNVSANGAVTMSYGVGDFSPVTWDPAFSVPGVTYTNGNLSISGNSANTKDVRTTRGWPIGKWYWEITATAGSATLNGGGIGIADGSWPNNASWVGSNPNSLGFGFSNSNPSYFFSWTGATVPVGSPPAGSMINVGNTYMFALDMDNQRLFVGMNGGWFNGGNPTTGAGPVATGLGVNAVFPAMNFYANSTNAFTANFGASAFTFPVPAGFAPGFYGTRAAAGFPAQLSTTGGYSPNFLLGPPITVSQPCTLLRFGIFAANTVGANVKMGLYTDSGGNPSTLLAQIPATLVPNGNLEVPTTPVNLTPGTYWLLANYDVSATVDQDAFGSGGTYKYISLPFSSPLPGSISSVTTQTNAQHINYYIVVAQ